MSILDQPRARQLGRRLGVRRMVGALGYDLVKRHYYSAIPDLDRLPDDVWTARSPVRGVRLDAAAGLRFIQRELGPFIGEYHPPLQRTPDPRQFYLENSFYEAVDAETLYAMVRRFTPRRIVELGSGLSTLVMADARARNGAAELCRHVVYDPYPRAELQPILQQVAQLHQVSATEVPSEEFTSLGTGDFLFVDTTHTVKVGSDVNRVILDVLPMLAPGVFVHFHDIYLPWEYPREFVVERRFFWAEQYLLQAFLAFNDNFEVLFGAHSVKRDYPDALRSLLPASHRARWPSAFWLRRTDRTAA